VFKDGHLVVRDGQVQHYRTGRALIVDRRADAAIDQRMQRYYEERYGVSADFMKVQASAIGVAEPFELAR